MSLDNKINLTVLTKDGSNTLHSLRYNTHYHSMNGAIQEAKHIFINAGLESILVRKNKIRILEMGFGSGLNAYLTAIRCIKEEHKLIEYVAIEKFPIEKAEIDSLNYSQLIEGKLKSELFANIHRIDFNSSASILPNFNLKIINEDLLDLTLLEQFDLVYYDAFDPEVQPELWTSAVFEKVYNWIKPSGQLLTYCAKGFVKRNLKSVGFTLEGLPGPAGKREITRATKTT